jgi:hypothetical protein
MNNFFNRYSGRIKDELDLFGTKGQIGEPVEMG